MPGSTIEPTIASLYQRETSRVSANLIRLLHGNFELAEESLQDVFTAALTLAQQGSGQRFLQQSQNRF